MKEWNQAVIQQYINDEVQESLTLDYKAADSLDKSDGKKKEITKDVSAMANSAGGIIIYGIAEYQDPIKRHLPEKIEPIDQTHFSKEWLEQIMNTIRPRVDGVVITPVPITTASNHVVYVVEIPQSTTAHQATDWRYYKRFNFQSVPMEDYEIRDVMGRRQHPKIELDFEVEITTQEYTEGFYRKPVSKTEYELKIIARNKGQIYAKYVNALIRVPYPISYLGEYRPQEPIEKNGDLYCEYWEDNTTRDVVDVEFNIGAPIKKYGPSWFDPILPGLSRTWRIRLSDAFSGQNLDGLLIRWSAYADNASPNHGEIPVKGIKTTDLRKS